MDVWVCTFNRCEHSQSSVRMNCWTSAQVVVAVVVESMAHAEVRGRRGFGELWGEMLHVGGVVVA